MPNIRYGGLVAFHYFPPQRLKQRMERTVGLSGEANVLCLFHPNSHRWVLAHRIINTSAKEKKHSGKMLFLCGTRSRDNSWWSCSGSRQLLHSIKFLIGGPTYEDKCHFSTCHPLLGLHLLNVLPVESSGGDSVASLWPRGSQLPFPCHLFLLFEKVQVFCFSGPTSTKCLYHTDKYNAFHCI